MCIVDMKVCTSCGISKSLENFSKLYKDGEFTGYHSHCKQCKRDAARESRLRKGIVPRVVPEVTETHKQCLMCNELKEFTMFSPSKRGRCGLSAYCRQCMCIRLDNESSREMKRRATADYRKRKGVTWRAMHRIHQYNRRATIKATDDGTVTKEFLENLLSKDICCWCGNHTPEEDRTIEHLIELSQGGLHSASNLDMACFSCNSARKGRK